MKSIEIQCLNDECGKKHEVDRTKEIPANVKSLTCNWCPDCESTAKEDYFEDYVYYDLGDKDKPKPYNDKNQVSMFSVEESKKMIAKEPETESDGPHG